MLKELKGDRREQTGMREMERLSLEWSRIVAAIAKSGKRPGKRCPAKVAMEQWVWRKQRKKYNNVSAFHRGIMGNVS